jgi:hypothetical protein
MSGLAANFTKDVWQQKKVCAVYPPGEALKLGDIYEYQDGVYVFHSTLASRGVKVKARTGPGLKSWDCSSKGTSNIVTKVKGKSPKGLVTKVLGKADAGVVVQLLDENAYVMSLTDISVRQVTNLDEISDRLKDWFWHNDWDSSYLVVTEVWTAKHATILTSGKSSTQVELSSTVDVMASKVKVADLSVGFKMVDTGQTTDHFIGEKLTPLFRAHRFSPLHERTVPAGRKAGYLDMMVSADAMKTTTPLTLDGSVRQGGTLEEFIPLSD